MAHAVGVGAAVVEYFTKFKPFLMLLMCENTANKIHSSDMIEKTLDH